MSATNTAAPPVGRTRIVPLPRHAPFLHCALFLPGKVLGDETFRLASFGGQEQVSDHFQFHLELHANTWGSPEDGTKPAELAFKQLLGRPVSVAIDTPEVGSDGQRRFREALAGGSGEGLSLFNGIVAGFAMQEPGVYNLTMRPALWKLTLTNRYRVLNDLSLSGAIRKVLDEYGIAYSMDAVSGNDNPAVTRIQDWLQAGESDYDFVRRLMNKAHIYYFFNHTARGHTVVFANRPAYPPAYPDGREVLYAAGSVEPLGGEYEEVVTQYRYEHNLTSSGVDGILVHQGWAWTSECVVPYEPFDKNEEVPGELPFKRYRVSQYGNSRAELDWDTARTREALDTSATGLSGAGHCSAFRAGYQFTLADESQTGLPQPRFPVEIRPSLHPQGQPAPAFVLTQVQHKASLDGTYSNQFQATEADGLISSFSVQDTQQGVVLAKVVGHENGVPPPDCKCYGPTSFDPETDVLRDDRQRSTPQGVWVQFATGGPPVWIKLAPHAQSVPELGAIVMVGRSSDADELPEIQNTVQANGQYTVTPTRWTTNNSVGNNCSTSWGDSKSVRFGNRRQDTLETAMNIVTQAYATGDYRDASYSEGAGYSWSTAVGGRGGLLSRSWSFGNTESHFEGDDTKSYSDVGTSYSESSVDVSDSISKVGVSTSTSEVGVTISNSLVGMQDSNGVTGLSNSISATGVSTSLSATGVQGGLSMTGVSGYLSMTGMSSQVSLTGVSDGVQVVGSSNNVGMTGSSVGVGLTGVSANTSLTGVSTGINLTGSQSGISLTGSSSNIGLTGSQSGINLTGSQSGINLTGSQSGINLTGSSSNINLTGSQSGINLTGDSNSISLTGSSTGINLTGDSTSISLVGSYTNIDISGGGLKLSIGPKGIDLEVTSLDLDLLSGLKLVL